MKRFFRFLALLAVASVLQAQILPQPVDTVIVSVGNDRAKLAQPDLALGTSGIVLHDYDGRHKAIVAAAKVIASDANTSTVELSPYLGFRQGNLPEIKTPPVPGDRVIMADLYHRVLPVTPNFETYDAIVKAYPRAIWVHPDLFAAELGANREPLPRREDFQEFCAQTYTGLVLFAFKHNVTLVDCGGWEVIGRFPVERKNDAIYSPFYNRFEEIPTALLDFSDGKIEDFDRHYENLIKVNP